MTDAPSPPASNTPEFSVSEISNVLKRTVEQNFSHVRVRGEISGFKRAASGHLYMALKDDKSVLDGVCWRGTAQRLSIRPEDGLEVIATGRLTTYPGRSKYQIVIEAMDLAGEGALLKLLEERKRKLEAEGLFDPDRKKPIGGSKTPLRASFYTWLLLFSLAIWPSKVMFLLKYGMRFSGLFYFLQELMRYQKVLFKRKEELITIFFP